MQSCMCCSMCSQCRVVFAALCAPNAELSMLQHVLPMPMTNIKLPMKKTLSFSAHINCCTPQRETLHGEWIMRERLHMECIIIPSICFNHDHFLIDLLTPFTSNQYYTSPIILKILSIGTSVSGAVNCPTEEARPIISLDMSSMNSIINIGRIYSNSDRHVEAII